MISTQMNGNSLLLIAHAIPKELNGERALSFFFFFKAVHNVVWLKNRFHKPTSAWKSRCYDERVSVPHNTKVFSFLAGRHFK